MKEFKTAAILACAGTGSRMGDACENKLLVPVNGMPVVAYALKAYYETEGIDLLIVSTQPELFPVFEEMKETYGFENLMLVEGGFTRYESVVNAVKAVPEEYDFVAIGDGARPLIRPQEIRATLEAAWKTNYAALGVWVTDTIKRTYRDKIVQSVPREELVAIQTPQVFRRSEYLELARYFHGRVDTFTDDASLFENVGRWITLVEGRRDNIKITLPEDIEFFKALLEARK